MENVGVANLKNGPVYDTDYTVAFWFKATAENARLCEAKLTPATTTVGAITLFQSTTGKVRFQLQGGEPGQRLYVDGRLIGTGKLVRRTKTSNRLGFDLGPGTGGGIVLMDELQIWSRALTSDKLLEAFKISDAL